MFSTCRFQITIAWPRTAQSSCSATAARSSSKTSSTLLRCAQKIQESFMFLPTVALLIVAAIEPGLGKVHYATSTKNADAQRYFDQGMAYLYGFNHEAAVKSFDQAAKLDPNLAMADWGIALALGPNINLDVDPYREKKA